MVTMKPPALEEETVDILDTERVTRYRALDGLTDMCDDDICIAGVGAVGRRVALCLATMGARKLTLYDPDRIETLNLGPQGYDEGAVNQPKVSAMRVDLMRRNSECVVHCVVGKFPNLAERYYSTLFICIDNMEDRLEIAEHKAPVGTCINAGGGCGGRIIDTRMAGLAARIITGTRASNWEPWKSSLHTDEEAFEAPCSLRLTTYGAQVTAGLAVAEYMALLQGRDPVDLNLDIMARAFFSTTEAGRSWVPEPVEATA